MIRQGLRMSLPGTICALTTGAMLTFCVWMTAPLLSVNEMRPFEGEVGRLAGVALLWCGFLLLSLLRLRRDGQRSRALQRDLLALTSGGARGVSAQRGAASRLARRPWYLVLGPPGVGKSSLLVNSGLNVNDTGAVAGDDAGFRIWLADEAVLIEGCGEDLPDDLAAVMKKHRKSLQLSGVVHVISLPDLIRQDDGTRNAGGAALRLRIRALEAEFARTLPLWAVFTRADQIAGFVETMTASGPSRPPLLGFALPPPQPGGEAAQMVGVHLGFDRLLHDLNSASTTWLAAEGDPARRSLIADFPAAMGVIRGHVSGWLGQMVKPDQEGATAQLRGVWFCSAGAGGQRVDLLRSQMLQKFGIERQLPSEPESDRSPRPVNGLFTKIVLPEAGHFPTAEAPARRHRLAQAAAIVALFGLSAAAAWPLADSYMNNRALIARIAQQVRAAQALIPPDAVRDSNLAVVMPALDQLSRLPGNPEGEVLQVPAGLMTGLYQGDLLQNDARSAYRNALNRLLLLRLVLRLEEVMESRVNDPAVILEALKIYLMLGQAGPWGPSQILSWFKADWAQQAAGPQDDAQGLRYTHHLAQLLRQPTDSIPLNAHLVARMRGILTRMPQAQRLYDAIVTSAAAAHLPPFRVADAAGPYAEQSFVRPSGAALGEGIAGLYTRQGFHKVVLPALADVEALLKRDEWVTGPGAFNGGGATAQEAIARDVLGLYYRDYIEHYERLMGDLNIIAFESRGHAGDVLGRLAGADPALGNLIQGIAWQTRLSQPDGAIDSPPDGGDSAPPPPLSGRGSDVPGAVVERHFRRLHDLVAVGAGPASLLDQILTALRDLRADPGDGGHGAAEATALSLQVPLTAPVSRWLAQIREGLSAVTGESLRVPMTHHWKSEVLPLCQSVTTRRYPFAPEANSDAASEDFARLFGPGGQLETFFQSNLAPYVDTGDERIWKSRSVGGSDPGLAPSVLEAFRTAALIRESFFGPDARAAMTIGLRPHGLSPQLQAAVLEIDGQRLTYRPDDQTPAEVTWPGLAGEVRLSLEPAVAGAANSLHRVGPWAWFRLMSAAERRPGQTGETVLVFRIGGRSVSFSVRAGGHSLVTPEVLASFRCPQSF